MGWKMSMIVIKSEQLKNEKELLESLGYGSLKKIDSQYMEEVLIPEEGEVYIGRYNGNIIICEQDLPFEIIEGTAIEEEIVLFKLFPNIEIASFILQSTINMWGYSLSKNGIKARIRLGSSESGTIIDYGDVLEEEKELFSNSSVNNDGERVFKFKDIPDDEFLDDQVGENFIFSLSTRFFGESIDNLDDLLYEIKFKGFRFKKSTKDKDPSESKHKIIAFSSVIEGSPINILHKKNGAWIAIAKGDIEIIDKSNTDNFTKISEYDLYGRIPKLKGMLNQKDNTTINIDYSTGEVSINPQHFHFGIPTHDAKSSRQANAGFDLFHYLYTTKSRYFKPIVYLLILFVLAKLFGWFFYIPFALYGIVKILELLKTRDMYYSGDLNPAIVIDERTNKIASLTNMSMGLGTYPLLRIRNYPLPSKYRKNGQKIPVAGVYQNTENYSHWNFYEPHPIPSGVKKEEITDKKIDLIPQEEWNNLKNEINKFKSIPKEGYYPINIETSNWKNIDLDKINWMQFGEEK